MTTSADSKHIPLASGQRLPPDERRRHLVSVARSIVESKASAALTMAALAEQAGVSRALVYAYFDNRAGLISALWDEVAEFWSVDSMPPLEELLDGATPEQIFDERLVLNTRWYLDQIERSGLLFYRLSSEPQLETSIEAFRRRIQTDNVAWWASLAEAMGISSDRALVYSSILNGSSEVLWELIARGSVNRDVIEEVLFCCSRAAVRSLLDQPR